jgi:hypothetical protein
MHELWSVLAWNWTSIIQLVHSHCTDWAIIAPICNKSFQKLWHGSSPVIFFNQWVKIDWTSLAVSTVQTWNRSNRNLTCGEKVIQYGVQMSPQLIWGFGFANSLCKLNFLDVRNYHIRAQLTWRDITTLQKSWHCNRGDCRICPCVRHVNGLLVWWDKFLSATLIYFLRFLCKEQILWFCIPSFCWGLFTENVIFMIHSWIQ